MTNSQKLFINAKAAINLLEYTFLLLVIIFLPFSLNIAQDTNYWSKAKSGNTKIYSLSFSDNLNGKAMSAEGELLLTVNGGKTWFIEPVASSSSNIGANQFAWQADIYCSVMLTTDGGHTWAPYDREKQEHFCGVYLKDNNTGYSVANEFLGKVTSTIINHYESNQINLLLNHPQQCAEYYQKPDEGWALGWCVKNFIKDDSR